MAWATSVRVGETVTMEHARVGHIGKLSVGHKSGNAVKLIFDAPDLIVTKIMDHRRHGVTWGLSSTPTAPLKVATA